ncbi:pimeloyl-ACP methyl ester carboxylesterase [Oxalobacteraceae bacterium GrIS 1.11]
MVARTLRLLLALQLLVLPAVCLLLIRPAALALGVAALGLILLRLAITANNFRLAWRACSPTPEPFRLRPGAFWRLFFGEFHANMLSSSWDMAWPGPALYLAPQERALPVLLIHGYVCNHGYWRRLSALLRRAGISHLGLDLEPAGAAIDDFVPLVHAGIDELCARSGSARVVIVAHSMGGLVARAYLRQHGAARIARVITLATPHHGTALAGHAPGHNARQMLCDNAWLAELAASETAARRALFTSLYSHHDNIVAPQTSACWLGARNLAFGAIGHVAFGSERRVLQCVLDEIACADDVGDQPEAFVFTSKIAETQVKLGDSGMPSR